MAGIILQHSLQVNSGKGESLIHLLIGEHQRRVRLKVGLDQPMVVFGTNLFGNALLKRGSLPKTPILFSAGSGETAGKMF